MSANAELVRRVYAAFNRLDLDTCIELAHPEIEIHDLPELPESEVFYGHDGLRKMFALNLEPWESFPGRDRRADRRWRGRRGARP